MCIKFYKCLKNTRGDISAVFLMNQFLLVSIDLLYLYYFIKS